MRKALRAESGQHDGAALSRHALDEHASIQLLLHDLERTPPRDERFAATLAQLMNVRARALLFCVRLSLSLACLLSKYAQKNTLSRDQQRAHTTPKNPPTL